MTLHLTPEMLAAAYDYLATTEPFCRWNMPESDEVRFVIDRKHDTNGWYLFNRGKHTIGVSQNCIGRTESLMEVMAHEMIHLHQRDTSMETPGAMHNAAFRKLAARVALIHGFDPKQF